MKLMMFFFIVLTWSVQASDKAQVLVVKGDVTKLEPGEHIAMPVKRGDWLIEDTSLVTNEKSFVKVRFEDRSTMNVGPNSMVVINKMPEEKANMVNLVQGLIKAEIKKEGSSKKTKTKMLVRTRSAVLGVRGTKFQTMYNHANKRTSLVTVEGSVALTRNIKKEESNTSKVSSESQAENVQQLDQLFDDNATDVVEVTEGKYSGVAESIERPTEPVKISPKQYNAIAKTMNVEKLAVEVMQMTEGEEVATGGYDKSTGKLTPKAGGIVDFETGLYIAPEEDAVLDKVTGTFTAKKIGDVNKRTGDYIPPKGIQIDAKKGFILNQKEIATLSSSEEKSEVSKTLLALNNGIVKKQLKTIKQIENEVKVEKKEKSWGPVNHLLSLKFLPYSDQLRVKSKDTGREHTYLSKSSHWIILSWDQVWNEKWTSRIRIGGHEYEIDDKKHKVFRYGDSEGDNKSFESLGIGYQYSARVKLMLDLASWDQAFVVDAFDQSTNTKGLQVQRREFQSLDFGVEYNTLKWFNLDTKFMTTLHWTPDSEGPSKDGYSRQSDTFGFDLEANGVYQYSSKAGIGTSLFYQFLSVDNSDYQFTRNSYGIGLNFIYDI